MIYIHGRAPKPRPAEFADVIREAFNAGLRLEHERAKAGGSPVQLPNPKICGPDTEPAVTIAAPLPIFENRARGDVAFTIAYYGDVTGKLMADDAAKDETFADKYFWRLLADDYRELLEKDDEGRWYDKPFVAQRLLAELDELVSYSGSKFGKAHWMSARKQAPRSPVLAGDNLGRTLDPVLRLPWVGRRIEDFVRPKFPDLYAYLKMRYFGSAIRLRLQSVLLGALARGDEICLVSHSLGTLVSYDVLWKIGWMSEYKAFRDALGRITHWLTMGSPLGWSVTKPYLYDGGEFESFKHPRNIEGTWHNIAAEDDPIAYDQSVKDDFKQLDGRKSDLFNSKTKIQDHKIYNPFFSPDRENPAQRNLDPHGEVGYLANKTTARLMTKWLAG